MEQLNSRLCAHTIYTFKQFLNKSMPVSSEISWLGPQCHGGEIEGVWPGECDFPS